MMSVMRSFHIAANEDVRVVFSFYSNYLFVFSKDWKLLKVIKSRFEESEREMYVAYGVIGNEIILAPFLASYFISINYLTGEQKLIEDVVSENEKSINHKYRSCFVQGECVWFVGEEIKKIICLEVGDTHEVIKEYHFGDFCWSYDYLILNKKIYIPSMDSNKMLIINTEKRDVEIKELSAGSNDGYCGIYLKGDVITLVDKYGKHYIYELDGGIRSTDITDDYVVFKSFNYKNNVIKLCRNRTGVYLEYANGEELFFDLDMSDKFGTYELPLMAGIVDEEKFICQLVDGTFYTYDDNLEKFKDIQINGMVDSVIESIHKEVSESMSLKQIVSESPMYEFKDWLQAITKE